MTATDRKIWALMGAVLLGFAIADLPGYEARSEAAREKAEVAELFEKLAHEQCGQTIGFHYKRAKLGIPNTTINAAGDVLIAQVFSVPVFGYAERVDQTAMCVLRRGGEFEFGVAEK